MAKAENPKQLITPAHALPNAAPRQLSSDRTAYGTLIDASVEYLRDNGWKESGLDGRNLPMFNDPTVADVKSRIEERVTGGKNRESGEPIVVKQMVCPVTSWDYKLEEAVSIQQDRDRIKESN